MDKGTILFHREFSFRNGESGKKLLIVLNAPSENQPYLVCKTTSKEKFNIQTEGCHSDRNIYLLNANTDWFTERIWIQFHDLYPLSAPELLRDRFKGQLEIVGKLRKTTIAAIINCIKRSQDISDYYLELLA